jgi:hypothetical protein
MLERRGFLKALLGVGAATVAVTTLMVSTAEALPVDVPSKGDMPPATAEFNPDRDGVPTVENAQFYYRRRRRRRIWRRRRRGWRRRRLYRRRRVIFL